MRWVLETDGTRTCDKSTYGSGAREPAGRRLHLSYFFFSAPEGGEKTRLGGELRREEHLIPGAGLSTDREGTYDDLSEGGFSHAFPPYLRHDRSRTRAEVRQTRLDELMLTSLVDEGPRSGWRRPRIVENSDTLYFIPYPKKYL
jgi:hypothetical protein